MKIRNLMTIFAVLVGLSACVGLNQPDEEDGKLQVVTTVGMLADMVENIAGDLVEVQALMGPGVDPHLYQPSAGDISKLENADGVFYVGLHLEGKMVEIFESLGEQGDVYAVGEMIHSGINDESRFLAADPSIGGTYDPHIWFDVDLWSRGVIIVEQALSDLDPENADVYQANADRYLSELGDLEIWVREQVEQVPAAKRVLITAHDAFGYFGRAYGVEVKGLQGISTSSDYGLKDLEEVIDFIVEREIKAVFVESSVPKKSIESLKEGVQAEGWNIEIGGELFSDAMGQAGTPEGTYVGMVKHNVNTIVNALK